jgi:hypothetical protein
VRQRGAVGAAARPACDPAGVPGRLRAPRRQCRGQEGAGDDLARGLRPDRRRDLHRNRGGATVPHGGGGTGIGNSDGFELTVHSGSLDVTITVTGPHGNA